MKILSINIDDLGGSTIFAYFCGSPHIDVDHIDVDIFGLFGPTKPLWQWMNFWAVSQKICTSRQVWETAGSTKTMQNSMGKVTTQARLGEAFVRLSLKTRLKQGESI